jgi:hypothetical protein
LGGPDSARYAILAGVIFLGPALSACKSGGAGSSEEGGSSGAKSPSAAVAPLVGRWEQELHCEDLVAALNDAGFEPLIPQEVAEYFPEESVQDLAKKSDPCAGAEPRVHSHFFDRLGAFGSLDAFGQQVDDGTYEIVDGDTFRIGGSTFDYHVSGGDTLALDPVITSTQRREALADPLEFSDASWMMAVAYPGTTWHRVVCEGWC